MKITFRSWFFVGALGVLLTAVSLLTKPVLAQRESAPAAAGGLTEVSLGALLKAMGLETTKEEKRYDFVFGAKYGGEDWQLSMSAVLSQDAETIWIMAWLDELPRSAADVPRSALLRLLGENDKLGAGKFFAFVPANRRFVLERVIGNRELTPEQFRAVLDDLGQSVVDTYPLWTVDNWTKPASGGAESGEPAAEKEASAAPSQTGRKLPSAINDSKFQDLRRN